MEFLFAGKELDFVHSNVIYTQKGNLGWQQDCTKVVFFRLDGLDGQAWNNKRARGKVNSNIGEGKELSTIESSTFNINNIFLAICLGYFQLIIGLLSNILCSIHLEKYHILSHGRASVRSSI